MKQTKPKYNHMVTLNAEQEQRLNGQRERGKTIIGLLLAAIQQSEKEQQQ